VAGRRDIIEAIFAGIIAVRRPALVTLGEIHRGTADRPGLAVGEISGKGIERSEIILSMPEFVKSARVFQALSENAAAGLSYKHAAPASVSDSDDPPTSRPVPPNIFLAEGNFDRAPYRLRTLTRSLATP
jgi:hypothetical protein